MIQLSIIVPLYNSEKYIRKCLDSLLNQDIPHSDYEIIVVNDGSPDNSYEIVAEYAKNYSNFLLVSQENQGTSGARNTGIDLAKGEFLTFVDPDDYVEANVYNQLIRKIVDDNLDMLRFAYVMVDENYNIISMPKGAINTADYNDEIVDGKIFLSKKLSYACYVWAFIYKTSLIKDNKLYYQQGFYIDDTEWLPRVLCHAKRVTSVDTQVLFYLQHDGSLINTQGIPAAKKKLDALFKGIEMIQMQSVNQSNRNVNKWYAGMCSVFVLSILNIISTYFYPERNIYFSKLKAYKILHLSGYRHSTRVRLKITFVNIFSERFYCWLQNISYK